ncbi:hypothetical protein HMSSN036_84450 [Paenibacillus macerans]|nr:hypothetical protein HMSSN036_84450 [Paenibacillus macerans]
MDLFSYQQEQNPAGRLLADRMRPVTLDEYIGQEHIVGPGKLLRRAIEADQISSICCMALPAAGKRRWPTLSPTTRKPSSSG